MHPFMQAQLAALHNEDLKAAAARARGSRGHAAAARAAEGRAEVDVVIRRTTAGDGPALAALAALDAAPLPFGSALVAEVAGVPRAVLPLDGGRSFGDPFVPTDELVALLEMRAGQIHRDERPARRTPRRFGWAAPAMLRRLV